MDLNPDYEGDTPEIEINIEPRVDRLVDLGISPEEFEAAVMDALDRMDAVLDSVDDSESTNALDNIEVELQGRRLLLKDIATITINDDLGEFDSDEEELEEDELELFEDEAESGIYERDSDAY
jgi:flavin-binding protein dodecin